MSFRNFTSGRDHTFGGHYLELFPHERPRYTNRFERPNPSGDVQVAVTLKALSSGSEVDIVQEGLPDAILLEVCYLAWQL